MAKHYDFSEIQSGNWNVAKGYVVDKIHKWLVLIDQYQTISTFGYSDLYNDVFMRDNNLKNVARISAFRRLIHAIQTLIRNTTFAVRGNYTKNEEKLSYKNRLVSFKDRLRKIEKNIDRLKLEKKRGNVIKELNIDEDLFEKMSSEVGNIIDEINDILNKNDLIFTHTEEIDPKKIKDSLKHNYINRSSLD